MKFFIFIWRAGMVPPYLVLFSVLILSGCAPSSLVVDDEDFYPVELEAGDLITQIPNYNPKLQGVEGSARAQVSQPGSSERATVYFTSNRESSLLRIRNQFGIEGGRVLAEGDSVTLYNRIDEYAQRFSKEEAPYHYLSGIPAMNLVEILNPDIRTDHTELILVSDRNYLLLMNDGTRFFLDRNGLFLTRIEFPSQFPEYFSTFLFQDHALIDGYLLPRRIQILSSDQKSNIFLLIRSLQVNPEKPDFNPGIPDEMQIERV